jgi:D-alanyl-D-alanine carboxypeptidase
MALLAQALLRDFPEHRSYLAVHAIQIGGKVLRNYNRLLDRYPGATGMKTGFICASGYNLVASAKRDGRELIAVVFGEYGGRLRNEHAAALLDDAFATPWRRVEVETTLLNLTSGESYSTPLDMRPYVCGPKRGAAIAALRGEDDDSGDVAESHLTPPVYLGPPIRVSAYVPADYGEPGFVARLPRPRPGAEGDADVLDAFAPVDAGADASGPAAAIGAAAGKPRPLEEVEPE